ncbi:MAG TPA: DUF2157 domain-containing protein [Bacteroidia bacterium]|nr:DUF2157 domain-containing protein [Bacteroidia bacterium]
MDERLQLKNDGMLSDEQSTAIALYESTKPMSVHWELRTILYLGILLLTSGISILVYLNIDTIGHQAILMLIAIACMTCFYFVYRKRLPYTHVVTKHPSPFFDYIVLLGCLLFGTFIGYIQFQYNLFGLHYGIAVLIPTLLYFSCAYLFDHKGVLTLGITGLAAWAGLTVTPLQLLERNDFSSIRVILTAIGLGLLLVASSNYFNKKNIKKHFGFSYNNFAANILFIATLSALFSEPLKPLSFLFLAVICFYYIQYAIHQQSFLFLLLSVIYGYIGLTYAFFSIVSLDSGGAFSFGLFYVMASGVGIVYFLMNYKKILKIKQ